MKAFDFDDELVLLEGIQRGLGETWACGHHWVTVLARRDTIEISMSPPASKKIFRMQELFLSQMDEEDLYKAGLIVGFEMAEYLQKHKRLIDPGALGLVAGGEGKRGGVGRAK
jgi:hypothetical protein